MKKTILASLCIFAAVASASAENLVHNGDFSKKPSMGTRRTPCGEAMNKWCTNIKITTSGLVWTTDAEESYLSSVTTPTSFKRSNLSQFIPLIKPVKTYTLSLQYKLGKETGDKKKTNRLTLTVVGVNDPKATFHGDMRKGGPGSKKLPEGLTILLKKDLPSTGKEWKTITRTIQLNQQYKGLLLNFYGGGIDKTQVGLDNVSLVPESEFDPSQLPAIKAQPTPKPNVLFIIK